MAYKIIPLPSDIPSQSQAAILENFNQLNIQFGTEHTALTAGALNGQHNYVTLQPQTPPFVVVPAADQQVVYGSYTTTDPGHHSDFIGITRLDVQKDYRIPICIMVRGKVVPGAGGTHNLYSFDPSMGSMAGYVIIWDENDYNRTIMSPFLYQSQILPNGIVSIPQYHTAGDVLTLARNGALSQRVTPTLGQLVSDAQDLDSANPALNGTWKGLGPVSRSINLNKSADAGTTVTIQIVGSAI